MRPTSSSLADPQRREARARALAFEPADHREALLGILRELEPLLTAACAAPTAALSTEALQRVLRRHPKHGRGLFSRAELIAGVQAFGAVAGLSLDAHAFAQRIRMRPVRTQSGVTPVTVLSKPFPCPGRCVFCPSDVRMPKSYLSREPGAQRAEQNGFDPYLQTYNRLRAFAAIGHPLDKAELIVLGGTWSFYPQSYQRWFIKRCLDAMNDLGRGVDGRAAAIAGQASTTDRDPAPAEVDGRQRGARYNRELSRLLHARHGRELTSAAEQASWHELECAQLDNEHGRCRNVGLSLETRPDRIDEAEVVRLRRLGCTKVQIGYQSLDDRVLERNQRGHDVAAIRRAMRLLRAAGFKIQAHVMPNLLGSTPEQDIADFARVFDHPDFRPDELKLYPCSLIESAELMRYYEAGHFRPYTHAELLQVLRSALSATPRYCRLSRVVRDISSSDIVAGNRVANFRELAERALAQEGVPCQDIRSREIKHEHFDPEQLRLRVTAYETSIGQEQFLELTTPEDRLLGFLRLSLPTRASFIAELAGSALIRELHVYGAAVVLGAHDESRPQHRGLGRWLMREASERAALAGYRDLAVISAIGTRPYYRKLRFEDGPLYQHLAISPRAAG
jgi:elongator complex protein 3